ncbi:hypothetical protein GCM10027267_18900 [Paramicrobacterium agarici]
MNSFVLDAGPCLNFLATNEGDLLHATLTRARRSLLVPQEVADEVKAKSSEVTELSPAYRRFIGLRNAGKFEVLASDVMNDDALVGAIKSLTSDPPSRLVDPRLRQKNRGEILVVAHAIKLREAGNDIRLLVDDRDARQLAKDHKFKVVTTPGVLELAARLGLADYEHIRGIYRKMVPGGGRRPTDHGLPRWEQTPLADKSIYEA